MIELGPEWIDADEAYAMAHDDGNPFVLDDLICETVTLWYGQSEIGKSRLIVGMVAALLRGEPFLERKPEQPIERILILAADSGGTRQYARRIFAERDRRGGSWAGLTADEARGRLLLRRIGTMTPELWARMAQEVERIGPDLIILDPVSRAANGNTNDGPVADAFYAGVDALATPTVIVGHSSIKPDQFGKQRGSQTPMGHTNWVNHARWRVEMLADGSGQLGRLKASGNDADAVDLTLRRGDRLSDFGVASETVRMERTTETVAEAIEHAQWVVANCQGESARAAGRALAREFKLPSDKAGERRMESGREVGSLLTRGSNNAWSMKLATPSR